MFLKWIQIMKLGCKAPQKQEVKILDIKTDQKGNTLYKIQWNNSHQLSWKPLSDLKEYYSQVRQFEREYQSRDADWSHIVDKSTVSPPKNNQKPPNHSIDSFLKVLENRSKLPEEHHSSHSPSSSKQAHPAQDPIIEDVFQQKDNADSLEAEKKPMMEQIQTADPISKKATQINTNTKKQINLILQKERQQLSMQGQIIYSEQMETQKNLIQEEKDSNELTEQAYAAQYKESLQQRKSRRRIIEKKLREGPLIKNKKKKTVQPEEPANIVAKQILNIYQEGRDWWAKVLDKDSQEDHVLRDSLKINQPSLLLDFYEKTLQARQCK